jgi:hypothetical protein
MSTGGDLLMKLVIVEWEDIVGLSHEPLPKYQSELLEHQLLKQTTGYLIEFEKYLVVVTDYDVSHHGEGYCHNDYTVIPKGVVRWVHELIEYTPPESEIAGRD